MLATRCPHCQTRFRVTPAQLELREGMVRCGACREIFNGRNQLLQNPEDIEALVATAEEETEGRMTLIDFGSLRGGQPAVTPSMQEELDALSKAITDLQNKPWTSTPESELHSEPEMVASRPAFVKEARKRQQNSRKWSAVLWLGIPILMVALTLQLTYFFRADVAAYSPQVGRYLRSACARLGCQVRLPEHIDLLSLESSQLQEASDRPGQYLLTALLRNQADTAQAWPALDLQLKTDGGQILIRKVFEPANYLGPSEQKNGIPARSEHEIQINLELTGEHPGGFSVTLFYH